MYIYKKLRSSQLPALEKIKLALDSNIKYIIIRGPTGSGKSFFPGQLSQDGYRVLACVKTKSLQIQYTNLKVEHNQEQIFTELFGKGNYICGSGLKERGKPLQPPDDPFVLSSTADICEMDAIDDDHKEWCRSDCDYSVARAKMVHSQAGIINYSKFLSDRPLTNSIPIRVEGFDPDILVFDEAHELADLVVDHSGLSYSWSYKRIMEYCQPIEIRLDDKLPLPIAIMKTVEAAIGWLNDLLLSLKLSPPIHPLKKGGDLQKWKWHKNTVDKVDTVLGCLNLEPMCWYVHADSDGITIRPKTAKYHFKPLFEKADKIVMMSATIQPRDIEALGISKEEYEFISMPNPYPAPTRPVHNLNCPTITWKSSLAECREHAQIISNAINDTSNDWTTLIHFPSKKKSEMWADWLHSMTRRPVFVPQRGLPTDESYNNWLDFKDTSEGAICCAWQFWTGIDGTYLNNVIVADMPYPNFGDPFEKARFDYSPSEARVRVANAVEQGSGRNRRGYADHYGPAAKKRNFVAGGKKFDRLKSAFDKDFLRSVV